MAYYTKVLQPDEKVLYFGKLHWIIYKNSIFLFILGATGSIVSSVDYNEGKIPLAFISSSLIIVSFLNLIFSWLVRISTEIVVTDRRILHKRLSENEIGTRVG